jgi:hypothetical protein
MTNQAIEDLARDAFDKAERVRMLLMMNTPIDYESRKKAFVELAVARVVSWEADLKLDRLKR